VKRFVNPARQRVSLPFHQLLLSGWPPLTTSGARVFSAIVASSTRMLDASLSLPRTSPNVIEAHAKREIHGSLSSPRSSGGSPEIASSSPRKRLRESSAFPQPAPRRQGKSTLVTAFQSGPARISYPGVKEGVADLFEYLSRKEIGGRLHMSRRTAKFHISNLLAKVRGAALGGLDPVLRSVGTASLGSPAGF
jgi:hypothetical protein